MLVSKQRQQEQEAYLLLLVDQIRKDHPTLSCRAMYYKIQPENLGRDRFEDFCREHGLQSERKIYEGLPIAAV